MTADGSRRSCFARWYFRNRHHHVIAIKKCEQKISLVNQLIFREQALLAAPSSVRAQCTQVHLRTYDTETRLEKAAIQTRLVRVNRYTKTSMYVNLILELIKPTRFLEMSLNCMPPPPVLCALEQQKDPNIRHAPRVSLGGTVDSALFPIQSLQSVYYSTYVGTREQHVNERVERLGFKSNVEIDFYCRLAAALPWMFFLPGRGNVGRR